MSGPVELLLLRHGEASPAGPAGRDADRPLTERGRATSARLGGHLAAIGFEPDVILTSPLLRARETADRVAAALGTVARVEPRLRSGVDATVVAAVLEDAGGPTRPLLVGHDPDFSRLVETLADAAVPLRTGTVVRIEFAERVVAGGGVLRWLLPPDALEAER